MVEGAKQRIRAEITESDHPEGRCKEKGESKSQDVSLAPDGSLIRTCIAVVPQASYRRFKSYSNI